MIRGVSGEAVYPVLEGSGEGVELGGPPSLRTSPTRAALCRVKVEYLILLAEIVD